MKFKSILYPAIAVASCNGSLVFAEIFDADNNDTILVEATAEDRLKQQPGVSVITRDDIRKKPPVNDVSELVRTMPGVNLTGNSATGSRGNNRQIDIRGMGPENTMIMIDGIPANSRSSVRYSWRGERDTRGDSNWVPAEQIDRIEVIRGPAAARYGSGASGGVVNIITKRPTYNWHGSLSAYVNQPQRHAEGDTRRIRYIRRCGLQCHLSSHLQRRHSEAVIIHEVMNHLSSEPPCSGYKTATAACNSTCIHRPVCTLTKYNLGYAGMKRGKRISGSSVVDKAICSAQEKPCRDPVNKPDVIR